MEPPRVLGYRRVSTEEQGQSGLGLGAQEQAIRGYVTQRGWDLVGLPHDVASGKTRARRPALANTLDMLATGQADVLVVAKLDRLARSTLDFATICAQAQEQRWNLVALDLGVDLSTPGGRLMANVLASMAQWEREVIAQRTTDAMQEARRQGARFGRPHTVGSDVRETILELRRAGESYRSIAKTLNELGVPTGQGGKRWHPFTVQAVEQRPR
jgi:DNA invertase Pin-like site-specific DNA recombinase